MNPERWRQIEELFHAALQRAPEDRQPFVEDACRGDLGLRLEVESMLAREQQARSFLETPALPNPDTFSTGGAVIGRQLGPYRILSPLGAGGMGEVYRAHDSKLGRDVAIKTLPPEFARDPERLARFRREARALATLNRPNIAAIYGLEESDNVDCLVLELVEGETLAERIQRIGPLPVEKALDYARQVAEALEAAHSKGIVHRDLKPANVKVTPEGRVKVLDFGLAKAVRGVEEDQDLSQLVTVTQLETIVGHIVGTPPYMSPEQARGKDVDSRTDIWAFGCLLYELLTGKRAFRATHFPTRSRRCWSASRTGARCPQRPRQKSVNCCGGAWKGTQAGGCPTPKMRAGLSSKHRAAPNAGRLPQPRPWRSSPLLVRCGCAIPLGRPTPPNGFKSLGCPTPSCNRRFRPTAVC